MASEDKLETSGYTYSGEKATGKIAGNAYQFSNCGSYAGMKVDRNTKNVFYFSGNMFLSSKNLLLMYPSVYVYPFRACYLYNRSSQGAKEMIGFDVITDYDGMTTGISDLTHEPDLAVQTGRGHIMATAAKSVHFSIHNANGMKVETVTLNAGESRTIELPAGLYLINGTKVIVN